MRGVCVGLLVERLVSPPALLLPRNASALLAGAAAALAHVAACSPQHCYGAFALRRVLLRGSSTYVLTDIGLVRAAASSNSGPGAAAAPAAAARHDLEVLARICCELASGVEPPAGVASSHAAATTYVHLAGSLLPPEVRPLLARCLLSDATAGPGSPSPEAAEVVECLAGLAHREEAAFLRPHSIAPDAAAGDPMLGAGGVGSAAPPPAAAAAAAATPGPPSEHSARRTNGGMKRPRAVSPSRAALPSGQGGAGEPTQGPGGGRRRQGLPARGPAARGAVTNMLTSPRPGDPHFRVVRMYRGVKYRWCFDCDRCVVLSCGYDVVASKHAMANVYTCTRTALHSRVRFWKGVYPTRTTHITGARGTAAATSQCTRSRRYPAPPLLLPPPMRTSVAAVGAQAEDAPQMLV